jgi:hypothetical protein
VQVLQAWAAKDGRNILFLVHGKHMSRRINSKPGCFDNKGSLPSNVSGTDLATSTGSARGEPFVAPNRKMGSKATSPQPIKDAHDSERSSVRSSRFWNANYTRFSPEGRNAASVRCIKELGKTLQAGGIKRTDVMTKPTIKASRTLGQVMPNHVWLPFSQGSEMTSVTKLKRRQRRHCSGRRCWDMLSQRGRLATKSA